MSPPPFDSLNLSFAVGDNAENVTANRQRASSALGVSSRWVQGRQVHGCEVTVVTNDAIEDTADCDGIVTSEPGLVLAVMTADCAPVVMKSQGRCGVVHAGWRGLVAGVVEAGVRTMGPRTRCWVGPCIGPCHFEVGAEVVEAFTSRFPDAPDFTRSRSHRLYFDLPEATAWVARSHGCEVDTSQAICTFCDDRFFSYRRDGVTGRQAGLVWL